MDGPTCLGILVNILTNIQTDTNEMKRRSQNEEWLFEQITGYIFNLCMGLKNKYEGDRIIRREQIPPGAKQACSQLQTFNWVGFPDYFLKKRLFLCTQMHRDIASTKQSRPYSIVHDEALIRGQVRPQFFLSKQLRGTPPSPVFFQKMQCNLLAEDYGDQLGK